MARAITRRAALGGIGLSAAAGVGVGMLASSAVADPPVLSPVTHYTVAAWAAERGDRYYIAHRGSGDVYPEHSMVGYQAAVSWGARCLEVSVGITSDGVLICMHDPTYDRTTNAHGTISALPSTILRSVHLEQTQLGPAWLTAPVPTVPLFEDVLRTFGGRLILAIEAKNDLAFRPMMDLVQRYGLQDSVIIKLNAVSNRIEQAHVMGYPVFAYMAGAADTTEGSVKKLAARLDAKRDCMVIPAYDGGALLADDKVVAAVNTGIPVWVYPVHRRSDAESFFNLGVHGIVTSSFGYVSSTTPNATRDTWAFQAIAPGEMTKDPASSTYAPTWSDTGELTFSYKNHQQFLTLGQLSPLVDAKGSYKITFEARWNDLPGSLAGSLVLAFGHVDDSYYEFRAGLGRGYHATFRADGRIGLFMHLPGITDGTMLAEHQTAAPKVGEWVPLQLKVSPTALEFARPGSNVNPVASSDTSARGGYLHLGRGTVDGSVSFRNFVVG